MWAPNRTTTEARRTPSVHSIASVHSIISPRFAAKPSITAGRKIQVTELELAHSNSAPGPLTDMDDSPDGSRWPSPIPNDNSRWPSPLPRDDMNVTQWEGTLGDDASSRSSTLDGEEEYMVTVDPKPMSLSKHLPVTQIRLEAPVPPATIQGNEPHSPAPAPHVPGPLESQLAALMSKLIFIEHANPTVSINPEEHEELRLRVATLEAEKKQWWKRHEAIWALRDEDVENNIKIRGLLAQTRRELEAVKALREEDLSNVQIVRSKLAEKTRELDRLQAQKSPHRGRPGSFFERRGTSDLFVAAKTAALEQRALDLEQRNSDLVAQVAVLKGGADIDSLNRYTAHQAWKDTVGDLEARVKAKDAQLTQLRAASGSNGGGMDWCRAEAVFEEHASYREMVGGKLQALRSDKETLQKELHRKENECQVLELKLQTLQRRLNGL